MKKEKKLRVIAHALPRRAGHIGKLARLPEDQVAQLVAWLLEGRTYLETSKRAKKHFGVTCSIMAVQTLWRRYAPRAQEMREERIIRRASALLQEAQ